MCTCNYSIQLAVPENIPTLVRHHRQMFEDIWHIRHCQIADETLKAMDEAYSRKLGEELVNGQCQAWVVKYQGRIVASGAVSFASMVPHPDDLTYKTAYLHSVFTEKEHRAKGLAELVVRNAIEHCKSRKISRMLLNASEAGRPIYEKIGFQPSPNTMVYSF